MKTIKDYDKQLETYNLPKDMVAFTIVKAQKQTLKDVLELIDDNLILYPMHKWILQELKKRITG